MIITVKSYNRTVRYLGLYNCGIFNRAKCLSTASSLPSSTGNLRSLYTLDLRLNIANILPAAVSKLECSSHLLLDKELL